MSARSSVRSSAPTFGFLRRLPSRLLALVALSRTRKGLTRLDAHLLRDIGLSAEEAEAEARRPIWDAPSHWKA